MNKQKTSSNSPLRANQHSPSQKRYQMKKTEETYAKQALSNSKISLSQTSFNIRSSTNMLGNHAESREDLIARYEDICNLYRQELDIHDQIQKERETIEADIASIFIQYDRITELIAKVKNEKEGDSQSTK